MKRLFFSGVLLFSLAVSCWAQQPAAPPAKPAQKSDATSPKTTEKPKRKRLEPDLSGFDLSDEKPEGKVVTMLGGSRAATIPSATLLAPGKAKFYGASAEFLWTFSGHKEGFVLLITDEDETQLVRQQLQDPRYRPSGAADKFKPGETYFWRVQVLPNALAGESFAFVVVSSEERQAIEKAIAAIPAGDPYQSALARARLFTDHRLWFDALGVYDELIARYPHRSELYEDRGTIYAQLEVTKSLAEADFARADELSHQSANP